MPNTPPTERRSADRPPDDAGWESKVVARLHGRLSDRANRDPMTDESTLGWEATVLDTLRKRIERGLK